MWPRDAVPVRGPHFTHVHPRVSSNSMEGRRFKFYQELGIFFGESMWFLRSILTLESGWLHLLQIQNDRLLLRFQIPLTWCRRRLRRNTRNTGLGVLSRVLSRDLSRVTLVLLDGHFYLLLQEVRHKCCIWTKCFQAFQRCRCTAYALKLLTDFFF